MASGSSKVVLTAIGGNSLITVAKFIGWFFTHSPSMLAESVHSLADTLNQILLMVGIVKSKSGPSKLFPWGTGKARYVWNLISAMGIFFLGFGFTTYHGVHSLLHPTDAPSAANALTISVGILVFSLIIEGYALYVALKEAAAQKGNASWKSYFLESDDPTVVGVVFEDAVAVIGVLIALTCIIVSKLFNFQSADAIGSIVIGVLMGFMALYLALINSRLLIGARAGEVKEEEIKKFLNSLNYIENVAKLEAVTIGTGQIHLSVDLEFEAQYLIDKDQLNKEVADIKSGESPAPILVKASSRMIRIVGEKINQLEKEIKSKFPSVMTVDIEIN